MIASGSSAIDSGIRSTRVKMLLLAGNVCQPRVTPNVRASSLQACCPIQQSTLLWIDEFVIGHRLCPWASKSRHSDGFRLLTIDDASQFVDHTVAAATELAGLPSSHSPWPTTLLVLNASAARDVAFFAGLCRQASALTAEAAPSVDLLGFHPARIDTGPGCSANPDDAAHYSVRSPLPTVQLLRQDDLDAARRDYAVRRSSALAGALELLYENKRRLREIGSDVLREQLRALHTEVEQP